MVACETILFCEEVLLVEAKKLELEGLEKNKFHRDCVTDLDELLNDIYVIRRPKPVEYFNRTDLVRIFNILAKELYGNSKNPPVVEGFGSFVMDMFSPGSDLDLSINFNKSAVEYPRDQKIQTLRKFAKKLHSLQRKGHVAGVQTILSARVPIVKFTDLGTGIECDLSVENRDGIIKSQIIHIISAIDERFQKLSFLMKAWAKAHDVNSSKDRTLNSLSIISLVAFHLQTRDPPILPPFSSLFKDGTDPANLMKKVQNYLEYGKSNKESLTELFITLFIKLASVEKLWQDGLCASVYEGAWIYKTWDSDSHFGFITVEDFNDRSQNVARAVSAPGVEKIYNCIHCSLYYLLGFLNGHMQGPKFKELLFGPDTISIPRHRDAANLDKTVAKLPVQPCFPETKKIRLTQGWGGTQHVEGLGGTRLGKGWGGKLHVKGGGGTQLVEYWGGKELQDYWEGKQLAKGQEGMQLTQGLGGSKFTESYGREQQELSWGGKQENYGESLRNVNVHFTQQAPFQTPPVLSSVNVGGDHGSLKLLSFPAQHPYSFERPYGHLFQPPPVSSQIPLGIDVSGSLNPMVPFPYWGPIHPQHAQNQPRSTPRR